MPIATRLTNTGTLLVNGSFDEASLAAGAISFNGSTQYLTGTSPNLSGTWTVEMWCYWTTGGTQTTIVSFNNGSNSGINLWKNSSNQLVADDGVNGVVAMSTVTPTINAWNHIAFVRVGTTTSGYVNGVLAGTTTYTPGTTSAVSVGRYNGSPFYYFPGYISNLRVVNGTAVYTAAFTPPQAILPSITNTSLLLNATNSANFIRDNGPNNLTLTNNGTATWIATGPFNQGSTTIKNRLVNPISVSGATVEVSNIFDEFTGAPVVDTSLMVWVDAAQTASYPGSGATWTDLSGNSKNYTLTNSPTFNSTTNGGVITFAGASSQYATTATTLFNSTTTNTYSINIWVYPTGAGQMVSVNGQATPNSGYHYTALEITAAGLIYFGQWTGGMTTVATSSQSLNAWYNLVLTYNGTTATAYVNGVSVGSSAIIWSAPGASTFFSLMSQDATRMSGATAYASGSIGAFSVYNRALTAAEIAQNYNALRNRYTLASITATQMPVVQRQQNSGTLLINSGSFDEFTGAPVVDTGLQLWLDAAQTASYPGSGATWTDLSGQSNTGTLTNSPTFRSNVGGGSFLFNGINQTATTASLNLQQNFTLEAWVNQNVLNGFAIFGQGILSTSQGLHIWYTTNTAIRFGMFGNDTDFTVSTSIGIWYHMIFTYNHSSPYTKGFYLNAVAQSGTPLQTAAAYAGSGVFRLGATYSTAGNYGNGYFEGVKMYNRILTADEITTNFNALRGRYGI